LAAAAAFGAAPCGLHALLIEGEGSERGGVRETGRSEWEGGTAHKLLYDRLKNSRTCYAYSDTF